MVKKPTQQALDDFDFLSSRGFACFGIKIFSPRGHVITEDEQAAWDRIKAEWPNYKIIV